MDDQSNLPFTSPDRDRYFDDYEQGAVHILGTVTAGEDEMLAFAELYDPQNIHISPEEAAKGPFGAIIASGWYTSGLMMRLYARHYLSDVSSLSSPGLTDLKWPAPVYAGDELTVQVTIESTRRSKSDPSRGIVQSAVEMTNQDGAVVMTVTDVNFIACRTS